MAVELLGNLGESTLSAAITSTSATTLTVTSATPFPAAVTGTSQFRVIVDSELMIVTNVSGTTFTVTRGAEGTTAATHSSLAPITHVITAAVLAAIGVPAGAGGAGKVLTSGSADYAQAWTTDNCGGGDYYRSGYYSHGLFSSQAAGTACALDLGELRVRPFIVTTRRAFDRIGINVTAAGGSTAVVRLGIYTNNGGIPGTVVSGSEGTVAVATTGAKELTISVTLDPGVYWLAAVGQVNASGCTVTAYNVGVVTPYRSTSTTPPTTSDLSDVLGFGVSSVTGSLPANPGPPAATAVRVPAVALRAA